MRSSRWGGAFALLAGSLLALVARADEVRVVVGFHGRADGSVLEKHGGRRSLDLAASGACAGYVPAERLRALRLEPGVAFVEEDLVRQKTLVPSDTYYAAYQADDYGLIRAPEAWDVSQGTGIRVAVLDTGAQLNHPDLGSGTSGKIKLWRNWTSFLSMDVTDLDGHGTHTAGTIGARTNNGTGVAAAGFNCELAIGKVLGPSGGYDSWIAAGMDWSWQTAGARVISMSLGAAGTSATLEAAVNRAWSNGVVVVAAAGNNASDQIFYPAAIPNCISVAATDAAGALASFSNFGSTVDLAAPGVSVASTYRGSGYALMSGTSMACPHVAGVAALVWATPYGTGNAAVRALLESGATLPVTGANAGSLKILDAYVSVTGGSAPTDPPDAPAGLVATPGNGQVTLSWTSSAGATGYTVKRSTIPGGPYSTIATGISSTSHVDAGLPNGTAFYYVVSASNAAGESPDSAEASATPALTPPAAPTNLAATGGNAQVSLSWTASSGAENYTVKRATVSGGPYSSIAGAVASTSYVDTGVSNGTAYFYVVSAVNAAGESGDSNQASATPAALPSAPANLVATPGVFRVTLAWEAVSGATSYRVKRSSTSGGPYTQIAGVTTLSYVNSTFPGTFYYVVTAVNALGESGASNEASATVGGPAPPPPR